VEIVEGRPQLEARNGKDVRFSVNCEKLNLQAPDGTITAQGKIKVVAPDLEGLCDALTINWKEDRIILEKDVRLKCQKDGQEVELTGERLTVKLTAIAPAKSAAASRSGTSRLVPTVTEEPSSRVRKVSRPKERPASQPIDPFDGSPQGDNN
jgi:hypothetical protein